ncbi:MULTISPECIES: hypothetical protein [Haematospirillum]|uniref:hypothetical protein n=1 Tax=Haematospirillum TaxID=1804663 RepID=UPI001432CF47|nr:MULTISPECIES: hypothetical protein [Haematospirillum]NKD45004.1 hypothetical protein [Haematospirillum jordaniae]NKD55152.1 hypothetical protein [Haematospirillum sp. H4890]NKD75405.1 hypothetical protein [Haematospirillum sp. H4485]NKD84394.1 hypothetical protein [Haematospirillum jordaniae]NKD92725.1 hypothetical protein [Haematospirillum jordaniae]
MRDHSTPAHAFTKTVVPLALSGHPVRTIVDEDGGTWFQFADVCWALAVHEPFDEAAEALGPCYSGVTPDGITLISSEGLACLMADIAERKAAEKNKRRSARLSHSVAATPDRVPACG